MFSVDQSRSTSKGMTWKEKSPREASRGLRRAALWALLFACPMLLLTTSGGAAKSDTVVTHAGEPTTDMSFPGLLGVPSGNLSTIYED